MIGDDDRERIARILALPLEDDDRAWVLALLDRLEPAWLRRRRRLAARDAAVRAAGEFFTGLPTLTAQSNRRAPRPRALRRVLWPFAL
jgi:hypothetical protein